MYLRTLALLFVILLASCVQDYSSKPDAGRSGDDAEVDDLDGGLSRPDGALPRPDGSLPESDGGPGGLAEGGGLPEPDAGPGTSSVLRGPSVVAAEQCVELTLTDQLGTSAQARTLQLSLEPATAGAFYRDAACTQSVSTFTIAANAAATKAYVKTTLGSQAAPVLDVTLRATGSLPASKTLQVRRRALDIDAGQYFACALLDNGELYCWGDANNMVLGPNVKGDISGVPVKVPLDAVQSVATGHLFACALSKAGKVSCWGWNQSSELGVDGFGSAAPRSAAILSDGVTRLAAGQDHACAVKAGALYCWGSNRFGQTGQPASEKTPTPTAVAAYPAGVVDVSCGAVHTCVVLQGGAVQCFGGLTTQLAAGGVSTLVRSGKEASCSLRDGKVQCWGKLTTNIAWDSPTELAGLGSGVSDLDVADNHLCAVKDGRVSCLGTNADGANAHGALGNNGLDEVSQAQPLADGLLPGSATAVATGSGQPWTKRGFSCAIADGLVYCWGSNLRGELGDSPALRSYATPQRVPALDKLSVEQIVISPANEGDHACVVATDGKVHCWGSNELGGLGRTASVFTSSHEPVAINLPGGPALKLSLGYQFACAVVGQALHCWGNSDYAQAGAITGGAVNPITLPFPVVDIALGDWHTCALLQASASERAVYCWGVHEEGRLGDGSIVREAVAVPLKVPLVGPVTALASGYKESCAVVNGGVQCWGGLYFDRAVAAGGPRDIGGYAPGSNHTVAQLTLAGAYGCALEGGTVSCWDHASGATGRLNNVTRLAAGTHQTCALLSSGQLSCRGENYNGQLGRGTFTNDIDNFMPVSGLVAPVKAFSTGGGSYGVSCAVDKEGMKCWGSNGTRLIAPVAYARPAPGIVARWDSAP